MKNHHSSAAGVLHDVYAVLHFGMWPRSYRFYQTNSDWPERQSLFVLNELLCQQCLEMIAVLMIGYLAQQLLVQCRRGYFA